MVFLNLSAPVLLILLSISIQAQSLQRLSLSGVIRSRTPIASADCYLKNNEQIGTVTNDSGYFHLSFSKSMLSDTLVILAMGFERKEVALASIDLNLDTVYYNLDQQSIVLQEILIESPGFNLKDMVLQAVANIPSNYPTKRHQLQGLYRKVSTQGTRFTHLEEAVIVVEDNGYRTPSDLIKIKTQHYRRSHDWGDIDSSYIIRRHKMAKAISAQLKISPNPLNRLYDISGIRHYRPESTWFNFKVLRKIINDRYTFELRDITVDQGDTLYHVAFAANPIPPAPQYVSGRNYLIINTNDLAIVEMQFTLGLDNAPLENQNHVRFRKHDDKYYPTYLKNISRRHINTNMDDDEYDIRIFWFDDVKPEGFHRIKSSEANDPDDPRSHQRNFAGQSFWDSTSFIQKHPLDKSVKMDLQRHESLEVQFMKNGVE